MVTITGDETIGSMVQEHPKSAGIMLKYGLHCVGCHVNQYETVRQGAMGHGMPEETVQSLIDELNVVLNKKIETLEVTSTAQAMIRSYAHEDGKDGWGLRIAVKEGFEYDMEFIESPDAHDQQFTFGDVKVFIDPESYALLKGSEIDFVHGPEGSGFRIDNPNKKP